MYLKPKLGITVPDPERGDTLPEDGREVPNTTYWYRRLETGDVAEAEPQVQTSAPDKAVRKSKPQTTAEPDATS